MSSATWPGVRLRSTRRVVPVRHELWVHSDGQDFCLAGPRGDKQRSLMPSDARLVWTVEADSHFAAMTLYYEHIGWGTTRPTSLRSTGSPTPSEVGRPSNTQACANVIRPI